MDFRVLLLEEWNKRRSRNPRYSLRAFAGALGIHSSTLIRILKGSRRPTARLADRILKRLDIDPSLKSTVLLSFHESPVDPEKFDNFYESLAPSSVDVINGWHHFAILSLFEIKGFQPNTKWIARYFGLTLQEVDRSLEILASLKLIHQEKGQWKLKGVATSSRTSNGEALRKIHREYIERALLELPYFSDKSDFSGVTMAIPVKKLPEAIRRIKEFRRNLAHYLCGMESTDLDEVYRLNIQLFPLRARDGSK